MKYTCKHADSLFSKGERKIPTSSTTILAVI